jgi:hypothetical protein
MIILPSYICFLFTFFEICLCVGTTGGRSSVFYHLFGLGGGGGGAGKSEAGRNQVGKKMDGKWLNLLAIFIYQCENSSPKV